MEVFIGFDKKKMLMPSFCLELFNAISSKDIEDLYLDLAKNQLRPAMAGIINTFATQLDCGAVTHHKQFIHPDDLKNFLSDVQSLIVPILQGRARNGCIPIEQSKQVLIVKNKDSENDKKIEPLKEPSQLSLEWNISENSSEVEQENKDKEEIQNREEAQDEEEHETELAQETKQDDDLLVNEFQEEEIEEKLEISLLPQEEITDKHLEKDLQLQTVDAFEAFVKSLSDSSTTQLQIINALRKIDCGRDTNLQSLADLLSREALRNNFDPKRLFFKMNFISPGRSLDICCWLNDKFSLGISLPKQDKPVKQKKEKRIVKEEKIPKTKNHLEESDLMLEFVSDLSDDLKIQRRIANTLKDYAPTPKALADWMMNQKHFAPYLIFFKKYVISQDDSYKLCEKLNLEFFLGINFPSQDDQDQDEQESESDYELEQIEQEDDAILETVDNIVNSESKKEALLVDEEPEEEESNEIMAFLKNIPGLDGRGTQALSRYLTGLEIRLDDAKRSHSMNSLRGLVLAKYRLKVDPETILQVKHYINAEVSTILVLKILRDVGEVIDQEPTIIDPLTENKKDNQQRKKEPKNDKQEKSKRPADISDFTPGGIHAFLLLVPELKRKTVEEIKYYKIGINYVLLIEKTESCSVQSLKSVVYQKNNHGILLKRILYHNPHISEEISEAICKYILNHK